MVHLLCPIMERQFESSVGPGCDREYDAVKSLLRLVVV